MSRPERLRNSSPSQHVILNQGHADFCIVNVAPRPVQSHTAIQVGLARSTVAFNAQDCVSKQGWNPRLYA
jgi:hypothetical protein